ncbi:MAG TPA: hypothetical protein VGN82_03010 [Bosea sp. (in: a-proteobacteria)]|jgi:ElaB/YqjD/DUF883 family membrane-anchored ribosome-binding protein|uniref:hypothetical protein n=1 Tax=Bosea sp. (in: a-proteobacteria) TaxID=1871050 RepID=UPI002E13F994|nr:hypothetical protein [Bosea sp. (in: a-proteobacteria)]
MATMNTFPPDIPKNSDLPKDRDELRDDIESTVGTVRAKASNLAEKATETVRDGYFRARDAITETDPAELARESGEAVRDAVVRHPLAAFGLGALSVGLIAWASLRGSSSSRFERYEPDYGRWSRMLQSYGSDAAEAGQSMLKSGEKWLRSNGDVAREQARDYAGQARDYADYGGRMIAKRAEREPIAALLGVGIAVYVIGSLLTSAKASEPAPARKRATKR